MISISFFLFGIFLMGWSSARVWFSGGLEFSSVLEWLVGEETVEVVGLKVMVFVLF